MMIFEEPKMEIIEVDAKDIITTNSGLTNGGSGGDTGTQPGAAKSSWGF